MTRESSPEKHRARGGTIVVVAAAALGLAAGQARAADLDVQTGAVYDVWRSSLGTQGSQFYVPLAASARAGDFSASLLTAYQSTEQSGGGDASVTALMDTKLGVSYEVVDKLPVDLLVGLDFNLPTGKTDLSAEQFRLAPDRELVSLTTFGEGFNVNPTLALAKSWGPVAAGLGLGYLWRGSYDPSSDLGIRNYDPGDVANLSAEARWALTADWEARLLAGYAHYGVDQQEGRDVLQEGDFGSLLVGARWKRDRWGASADLQSIYRGKNRILDSGGDLTTEEKNSHGVESRVDLAVDQRPDDQTELRAGLRGLWVTENGYDSSAPRFVGSRQKVSLTLGGTRRLTSWFSAGVDLSGFWMRDDEVNLPEHRDPATYRGGSAALRLTASF